MGYLLGIDLGTSSVRVILIDRGGSILGLAGIEYPTLSPRLGWAEQDPNLWWRATCDCIREVVRKAGVKRDHVSGIGLSGQMHGLVLIDEQGNIVRPAIIWPDTRTAGECTEISRLTDPAELYSITGLPVATGFFGVSLLWVRKNEPSIYEKVSTALLPKDYIRYRLTGEIASDPTDACGTLLFNINQRDWSPRVVQSLGLKAGLLPRILESAEAAGSLTEAASQECGLEAGIPVAVGGGDQAMAALGLGMIHEGEVACSIGTGGQVVAVGSKTIEDPKRRVHVLCHVKKDVSLVMGAVLAAGLSLRWFRDNLGDTEMAEAERNGRSPYELFSDLAERVVPGAEGLIFLPYLSGERTPHMDPNARGCFIGLTLSHTKAHMVRALLEGVAFAMKDSLSLVREFGVPVESLILSGGGAKSAVWRRIQADVYNLPARVAKRDEHSAYGAALIAGVACGLYASIGEAARIARSTRGDADAVIVPNKEDAAVYQKYYETFRSLYPSLRQAFQELSLGPG